MNPIDNPKSAAADLIRWMEVPRHPNVFALGNLARQVTFASQQTRALNLVWALLQTNRLAPGQRVAVVGAGLGGMMTAAAALAAECDVDLYEKASQTCPLQRGNDIRFIHPNILGWPDEGSELAATDFPFLNWTAATVRGVVKQIDLQWARWVANKRLRQFFNYQVTRLYVSPTKAGPQRPWLAANHVGDSGVAGDQTGDGRAAGYLEESYDCIVLAVGFGEEQSMLGVPFLSYWENDSLHQETGRGRRNILVSGCGDGGLIDALRLRLRNFDHADFVRRFLTKLKSPQLIDELRNIDASLAPHSRAPDISLRFRGAYERIKIPSELRGIEDYFRDQRRADTTVTLNSPAPGPFSFQASLLNRFATYLAMRNADLHYLSGRVVAERIENENFRVTLQRDDVDLVDIAPFDLIIVRHGPKGAIPALLPTAVIAELREWWLTNPDITTQAHWRAGAGDGRSQFFVDSGWVPSPTDAIDLAISTFEPAYRELRTNPSVQSVAVGEHDGKAGFIVTLKPGSPVPESPPQFASVLVQYVVAPSSRVDSPSATPEIARPAATVWRTASVGEGIYNYDAGLRRARSLGTPSTDPDAISWGSGIGTLGCFATDRDGLTYLVSTAFVLAPDQDSVPGDRIFREGEGPKTHQPIATLSRFVPSSWLAPGTSAHVDAACARLLGDVRPDYELLDQTARLTRLGLPGLQQPVVKVGRTSGLTRGTVDVVNLDIMIHMSEQGVRFVDCFSIIGDGVRAFSTGGDAGAVIMQPDGTGLGMLIGGSSSASARARGPVTIACSLEASLKALDLTLLHAEAPPTVRRRRKRT